MSEGHQVSPLLCPRHNPLSSAPAHSLMRSFQSLTPLLRAHLVRSFYPLLSVALYSRSFKSLCLCAPFSRSLSYFAPSSRSYVPLLSVARLLSNFQPTPYSRSSLPFSQVNPVLTVPPASLRSFQPSFHSGHRALRSLQNPIPWGPIAYAPKSHLGLDILII